MPSKPTHPDIEVRAGAMSLFVAAFDVFPSIAQKYLITRGFAKPDHDGKLVPARTYISLDSWLETFNAVLADIGPNALFKIGQRIIGNPHFPASPPNLEGALRMMDVAYHMSHRKGGAPMFDPADGIMLEGIGHYAVQLVADQKKILVNSDTPYPCPLEHGIVSGVALRIEWRAVVSHQAGSHCRNRGSPYCTYSISW